MKMSLPALVARIKRKLTPKEKKRIVDATKPCKLPATIEAVKQLRDSPLEKTTSPIAASKAGKALLEKTEWLLMTANQKNGSTLTGPGCTLQ